MARLNLDEIHRNAVARKEDKVEMLEALVKAWEDDGGMEPGELRDLRRRLRAARVQLEAMRP